MRAHDCWVLWLAKYDSKCFFVFLIVYLCWSDFGDMVLLWSHTKIRIDAWYCQNIKQINNICRQNSHLYMIIIVLWCSIIRFQCCELLFAWSKVSCCSRLISQRARPCWMLFVLFVCSTHTKSWYELFMNFYVPDTSRCIFNCGHNMLFEKRRKGSAQHCGGHYGARIPIQLANFKFNLPMLWLYFSCLPGLCGNHLFLCFYYIKLQ